MITSDLVNSLRRLGRFEHSDFSVATEAADEIILLTERVRQLREELKHYHDEARAKSYDTEGVPE